MDYRLFDQSIVGVFPKDVSLINYMLAFFNSSICTKLINAINPSTNNSANYIKKIPFIIPTNEIRKEVELIVESILAQLKTGNTQIDKLEQKLDHIFDELYLNRNGAKEMNNTKVVWKPLGLFDTFD